MCEVAIVLHGVKGPTDFSSSLFCPAFGVNYIGIQYLERGHSCKEMQQSNVQNLVTWECHLRNATKTCFGKFTEISNVEEKRAASTWTNVIASCSREVFISIRKECCHEAFVGKWSFWRKTVGKTFAKAALCWEKWIDCWRDISWEGVLYRSVETRWFLKQTIKTSPQKELLLNKWPKIQNPSGKFVSYCKFNNIISFYTKQKLIRSFETQIVRGRIFQQNHSECAIPGAKQYVFGIETLAGYRRCLTFASLNHMYVHIPILHRITVKERCLIRAFYIHKSDWKKCWRESWEVLG